jgi:hypothetical protein
MTKFKILYILFFLLSTTTLLHAQIGIGTTNPQGALDITSTTDGLLIPRVSLGGANFATPLTTPINSELIYNTNNNSALPPPVLAAQGLVTPGFYFWNASISRWERFATGTPVAPAGWLTTGNSAIATDFLGTTNAQDLVFRSRGNAAGRIGTTSTSYGIGSLVANTGANNTAFGTNALAVNTDKVDNTAIGHNALAAHTASPAVGNGNTAVGSQALASLSGGTLNTAVGFEALRSSSGITQFNTAVGAFALRNVNANATQDNVAVGYNAMGSTGQTITGSVAVGASALISVANNTTRNTAIGVNAGSAITSGSDNVVIGANAQVLNAAASNQVRIGSSTINYAGVQVAWSITSDKRWKNTIQNSPLGLDFIKTLRPVSYIRNDDKIGKTEYGFIAQELEDALIKAGDSNNAIISKDDNGMYGVRYNDFISITVKAIQEQQEQIEELKKTNTSLQQLNALILKRLETLEKSK